MTARTWRRRALALLASAGLLTGAALTAGAAPASAVPNFTFSPVSMVNGDVRIDVKNNGTHAGYAYWWQDPYLDYPGDTLVANDSLADGWGIRAHLSTGRVASTAGHNSPYEDWASGDLGEGNRYTMWVCAVKGDTAICSNRYEVTA